MEELTRRITRCNCTPKEFARHFLKLAIIGMLFAVPSAMLGFMDKGIFNAASLFAASLVLADMVLEDAKDWVVDIRKAAAFAILMCFGTSFEGPDFLVRFALYFMILRIFYLVMSIAITLYMYEKKAENTREGEDEEEFGEAIPKNSLPFIPCFYGGAVVFLGILMAFNGNIPLLSTLEAELLRIYAFMPFGFFLLLVGHIAAVLVVLEIISFLVDRKYQQYSGIGLGDIFVLPSFAAFFGGIYFTSMFAASLVFVVISALKFGNCKKEEADNNAKH